MRCMMCLREWTHCIDEAVLFIRCWSPEGKVLTRIQPPDHYHHYGIWSPWTMTHIEGREVDFWNLNKGQGTVRFAGVESILTPEHPAAFGSGRNMLILQPTKPAGCQLRKFWMCGPGRIKLRAGRCGLLIIQPPEKRAESPIELDAYRYGGGLGFRATEEWTKETVRC